MHVGLIGLLSSCGTPVRTNTSFASVYVCVHARRYLNNETDSNVRLRLADGRVFHAHRIALQGTGSAFLADMLSDEMLPEAEGGGGQGRCWEVCKQG